MTLEELSREVDKRTQKLIDAVNGAAQAGADEFGGHAHYYERIAVTMPPDKVIRADYAIVALEILTLRTIFFAVPTTWKAYLQSVVMQRVRKYINTLAAARAAGTVPQISLLLGLLNATVTVAEGERVQQTIENDVRRISAAVRRELYFFTLYQGNPRRIEEVASRHPKSGHA